MEAEAIENLREALELTLEHAPEEDLQERLREEVRVSSLEVMVGQAEAALCKGC